MEDIAGITFFAALGLAILVGLKALSRERKSTADEFEERAAEGASMVAAGVKAQDGVLNPASAKGESAIRENRELGFGNKRREGKSVGEDEKERDGRE